MAPTLLNGVLQQLAGPIGGGGSSGPGGIGAAGEVTFWSAPDTLAGDPAWTYDAATNQQAMAAGAAAAPSYTFQGDLGTGMYRVGASQVGIACGGVLLLTVGPAITSPVVFYGPVASAALPTYSWPGDPNSGMYNVGADQVGISTNGVLRLTVNTANILSTLRYHGPDGTAALPTYSFSSDPNTGMHVAAPDVLAFATGGTDRVYIQNASMVSDVIGVFPAAAAGASGYASIRLPHGVAPDTNLTNGDLWTTTAGLFARINGATVGPFSAGGGTIGGTIAATQVAFGTALDTIGGDAGLVYDSGTNQLQSGYYSFTGTPTTGFTTSFADDIDVLCGGTAVLDITAGRLITNVQFQSSVSGNAATPAYSFSAETTSGLFRVAGNNIGISIAGTQRWDVAATQITSTIPLRGPDGLATNPSYSWSNGSTTGLYLIGTTTIGLTTNSTLRLSVTTTELIFADTFNITFNTTTGTKIGTAVTEKIGFWNAAPVVQPAAAAQAALAAYATGAFGLDSNANMQALYDLVMAMRTALVDTGIMKGAA